MRITGGRYRGRKIRCPKGTIRPTMDRMRESLFAILGDLEGCSFLDLFSGSGVVGIEAASRGAHPVVLVEKDRGKREVLIGNLSLVTTAKEIHILPVERFVKRDKRTFDFIYIDPPFAYRYKADLISRIDNRELLATPGRLILHLPAEERLPERIGRLVREDRRQYGGSMLLFYTK